MKKILIVEDEFNISNLIKDTLNLRNYETIAAFDGKEALEKIQQEDISLILLDVMIPELNGFEVMERIAHQNIPVIFLSARTDVESIVKGLKLGAQDYIKKPFEPLELLARVEMILGRFEVTTTLTFKKIELDIDKRMVINEGKQIDLTPKEFELLELLMKNKNIALSRDSILDKVWGITAEVETRTVDFHIQQLRKKLGLKEDIVTVNKVGYRLEEA